MNSNIPFFSIILPTYNRAYIIDTAIDSVFKQTFKDWELIVVDDASTDNTAEVIKTIEDPRVKYIKNEKNSEKSASRNNGIAIAQGKYICFIDDDDFYLPEFLEEFYKKIKEKNFPVAMFYCGSFSKFPSGEIVEQTNIEIDAQNYLEFVMQKTIASQRACLSKKIFDEFQYDPDNYRTEDLDLWLRVLKKYPLYEVEKPLYVFYEHDDRSVHISNIAPYLYRMNYLKKVVKEDNGKYIRPHIGKKLISESYFILAKHYEYNKESFKTISTLVKSIVAYPKYRLKEKIYMILNNTAIGRLVLKANS